MSKMSLLNEFENKGMTVDELVRSLERFSPKDFVNCKMMDKDNIDNLYDLVKFSGYDPKVILESLYNDFQEAKEYNDNLPDGDVSKLDNLSFIGDMTTLIFLIMTRGTNITSILQRTSDDGVALIQNLQTRYRIVSRVGDQTKKSNKNDAVTLPRIASLFPQISTLLYISHSAKFRFPYVAPVDEWNILSVPGIASLIPADRTTFAGDFYKCVSSFSYLNSLVIEKWNRRKGTPSGSRPGRGPLEMKDIDNFTSAAQMSNLFNDSYKYDVLESIGLIKYVNSNDPHNYVVTIGRNQKSFVSPIIYACEKLHANPDNLKNNIGFDDVKAVYEAQINNPTSK